jgi:hypothetical protein
VEAVTYAGINERKRAGYYGICRSIVIYKQAAEYIFEN